MRLVAINRFDSTFFVNYDLNMFFVRSTRQCSQKTPDFVHLKHITAWRLFFWWAAMIDSQYSVLRVRDRGLAGLFPMTVTGHQIHEDNRCCHGDYILQTFLTWVICAKTHACLCSKIKYSISCAIIALKTPKLIVLTHNSQVVFRSACNLQKTDRNLWENTHYVLWSQSKHDNHWQMTNRP